MEKEAATINQAVEHIPAKQEKNGRRGKDSIGYRQGLKPRRSESA